jgi:long-chain fatty acid transport protein
MKTRILFVTSAAVFSLLASERAWAAGTALDVQSGRGTGMASALTAATDDSASIFYNPAGIARGKILDVQVGDTLIVPSFKFTSPTGNETKLPFYVVPPFHGYASGGITDNLSIGIGVFTPYGLKVKWPDGWEGRRFNEESKLYTYYFNPTVAYRIGPVRLGAGFQLVRATVELKRALALPGGQEGEIELGAGTWGVGGNGGIQVDAIEQYLTVGAQYRSAVSLDFDDGNAHFSNIPPAFQPTLHDQKVSTSITQPDQFAVGVSSRPIKKLLLDLDVVWLGWKKFRSLTLNFPQDTTGTLALTQATNWDNTVNYHLGGEYTINDSWKVRTGLLYDRSPSPAYTLSPVVPDADRLNIAGGASYVHKTGFRIDAGYQFIVMFSKTSTYAPFPGDYGGFVNLLSLTVGYRTPEKHPAPVAPPLPTPPTPPTIEQNLPGPETTPAPPGETMPTQLPPPSSAPPPEPAPLPQTP